MQGFIMLFKYDMKYAEEKFHFKIFFFIFDI